MRPIGAVVRVYGPSPNERRVEVNGIEVVFHTNRATVEPWVDEPGDDR